MEKIDGDTLQERISYKLLLKINMMWLISLTLILFSQLLIHGSVGGPLVVITYIHIHNSFIEMAHRQHFMAL